MATKKTIHGVFWIPPPKKKLSISYTKDRKDKTKETSLSGGIAFALRCRKHLDDLHRDSTRISRTGWSDGTGTSAPSVALWPAAGYELELWLTNLFKWLKMNWVTGVVKGYKSYKWSYGS